MKTGGLLLAALGAFLIWQQIGPDVPVVPPSGGDVLDQSYRADRTGRVAMLRELAVKEFPNDAAKADWHNEQAREITTKAFQPYVDALAEALVADTVAEFADSLEK